VLGRVSTHFLRTAAVCGCGYEHFLLGCFFLIGLENTGRKVCL
jgi:hypothetical protein